MSATEMRLIQRLVQEIESLKLGLDPEVLAAWYRKVEVDAKARAPDTSRTASRSSGTLS